MTNLDIIKYLAISDPSRLAELLDDIYCSAWNCGSCAGSTGKIMEECEIDDFGEWINQEANTNFFFDYELTEWSKAINPTPTLVAFYGTESKVIEQAIDEIKLLENVLKNYPDSVCISFREKFCIGCLDADYCPQSKMAIVECPKFDDYINAQGE